MIAGMKLLSLNCEGDKHLERIIPLLQNESPDCICLQEAPEVLTTVLQESSYYTTFVPLTIRDRSEYQYQEGLLFASRHPHERDVYFYHRGDAPLVVFEKEKYRSSMKKALLYVTVDSFRIAVTHFTWTENGAIPNDYQQQDIGALLQHLDTLPPHLLCGDFNIPRHINPLYEEYLAPRYTDAVPAHHTSSLDPVWHRHAHTADKQHLFSDYMVDYIFTTPPYVARDTRLLFGVSDHAALVTTIEHS